MACDVLPQNSTAMQASVQIQYDQTNPVVRIKLSMVRSAAVGAVALGMLLYMFNALLSANEQASCTSITQNHTFNIRTCRPSVGYTSIHTI